MRRIIASVMLWLLLAVCANAQITSSYGDLTNAMRAYGDVTTRFWAGTASTGHLKSLTNASVNVGFPAGEIPAEQMGLWSYGQAFNILYTCWKICPSAQSADALTRIRAVWDWIQPIWPPTRFTLCGSEATNPVGTAQDDLAWTALMMFQMYDVFHTVGASGASQAITNAEAAMTCSWNEWSNSVLGGVSLYYDDSYTNVQGYISVYVYDLLLDWQFNANATSLSRAITIESWAETAGASCDCLLSASGLWYVNVWTGNKPTWSSGVTYNAGQMVTYSGVIYCSLARFNVNNEPDIQPTWWTSTTGCGYGQGGSTSVNPGTAGATDRNLPTNVHIASSSSFIAGNMFWAAVDIRLYANSCLTTCNAVYLTRAQTTATAILTYEQIPTSPFGVILMDDRDANTDGMGAYPFANEVMPQISASAQTSWRNAFLSTARSVAETDRDAYGDYGGDWMGWSQINAVKGGVPSKIEVSANAAIWPIVALKWAQN